MNQIVWTNKAIKQLMNIDKRFAQPIRSKVNLLVDFPMVNLDIKHLSGKNYRLRHGDYRIFFEFIDGTPKIIKIERVERRNSKTYAS